MAFGGDPRMTARGGGGGAQGDAPARDPQALARTWPTSRSSPGPPRRRAPTRSPASTRCSASRSTWRRGGRSSPSAPAGSPGPAIRPVAVRMAWQAARAVKIPVIGIGGITSAAGRARVPDRGLPRGPDRHRELRGPRALRAHPRRARATTSSATGWSDINDVVGTLEYPGPAGPATMEDADERHAIA